jgi:hypothetical protein
VEGVDGGGPRTVERVELAGVVVEPVEVEAHPRSGIVRGNATAPSVEHEVVEHDGRFGR